MGRKRKQGGSGPRVDGAAKVAVLEALREGRRLQEVAAAYGVTVQAFYMARRRDALFAAAWRDAHALAAEAERRPPEAGDPGGEDGDDVSIVPNNRRVLQRRKMRHVRFDERRRGVFLAHFAASCDLLAAAAAAGVCERTVYVHRCADPDFAAAFQAALQEGYGWLEAEALRQRLAAQARLRAAVEEARAGAEPLAALEAGVDFERAMKLLARWDRRGGGLGPRSVRHGRQRRWTFDEAITLLAKRLRALGVPTSAPVSEAQPPADPV